MPAAEGWYQDPYGRHEARWFSDGAPTALVRDGDAEAHDPPPEGSSPDDITPAELPDSARDGADLQRADEAEASYSASDETRRVEDEEQRTPSEAVIEIEGAVGPMD